MRLQSVGIALKKSRVRSFRPLRKRNHDTPALPLPRQPAARGALRGGAFGREVPGKEADTQDGGDWPGRGGQCSERR